VAVLTLTGCSATTSLNTVVDNTNSSMAMVKQRLQQQLADEPLACNGYRADYVAAFALNVKGLSDDNEALQEQASATFVALQQPGVNCRLPQCIIEPLQEGKLTYWCGYREQGVQGQQVNIWFAWDTLALER
jgi:hypothetical protein